MENTYYKKLDYSLSEAKDRKNFVEQMIREMPNKKMNKKYIEILSDYIISAMTPEEKKQKRILTDNRMVTVNKRETSYQGLADQFENGEDGIYNLMIDDKNVLLTHKVSITEKDKAEVPGLAELCDGIARVEKMEKSATGKKKFLLKKQLIEMHQEQYILKESFKNPICAKDNKSGNALLKGFSKIKIDENITINDAEEPFSDALISFFDPNHVSALLCNYCTLKEDVWGKFDSDGYYLMEDLDNLVSDALEKKFPLYYKILIYKIDGRSNAEIQELLQDEFNTSYTVEYLSSLWRKKIPKIIAKKAKENYLIWYYTYKERGKWKKCSRCGEIKLANNMFFSKNNTSKDHYYSICKECRNKKAEMEV